jgi:hypothetical protein
MAVGENSSAHRRPAQELHADVTTVRLIIV